MKRILIIDEPKGKRMMELVNPGEPESPPPPNSRWINCTEDDVWFDWTFDASDVPSPPVPYQFSSTELAVIARQVAWKAIQEDLINAPEHAERPEVIDYKDKRIS